jgi:hypothetical protein
MLEEITDVMAFNLINAVGRHKTIINNNHIKYEKDGKILNFKRIESIEKKIQNTIVYQLNTNKIGIYISNEHILIEFYLQGINIERVWHYFYKVKPKTYTLFSLGHNVNIEIKTTASFAYQLIQELKEFRLCFLTRKAELM